MMTNVLKDEVGLCYQAGMNDFIDKPFDTLELLQKINQLLKNDDLLSKTTYAVHVDADGHVDDQLPVWSV